jgi:hypothetical protein
MIPLRNERVLTENLAFSEEIGTKPAGGKAAPAK